MSKKQPTAVGVYIFAGGFTVGVSKYFNVLAHLEDGDFGVDTTKLNFPKLPVYTDPKTWPLKTFYKKTDFVYCNPPCAPWSATGSSVTKGYDQWKTDPRVACVDNAFTALEAIRPRVWVWESVPRAFTAGRALVDSLTKRALKMGYSVTYFFTDAQLHGLPQRRQRFHMVCHDVDLDFTKPPCKILTVGQALRSVKPKWYPQPSKTWVRLARNTKPGDGLRETFDKLNPKPRRNKRGQAIGRPTWMNFRLAPNEPCPTLIGACHAVHHEEPRLISPEEQAALCGYPKSYKWAGKPLSMYPQICRAVTPTIGTYLGDIAATGIKKNARLRTPKVETVDFRKLVKHTKGAR